ncbi:MAG: undecaprenyl-diphosphate phosphatase, partial [Rhodospirillales bacterium]
ELDTSNAAIIVQDAFIGAAIAFVTAYIAISLMMGWLRKATFTPFVVYRVLLGAVLLFAVYF